MKVVMAVQAEVVVADVSPAQDDGTVVCNDELIVHARIHLIEACQKIESHAGASLLFGIE